MTASQAELVTGYYRFTDIIWEWHQALPNPDDISPLKAMISWDTLVHPDHPLRKPGQDGLELFRGILSSGEARLLFSSAQVEYIRYYLHAMKLTAEPIPLPASEWLIRRADLKSCAPDYYTDGTVLKKAIKSIEKVNKRLKGLGGDSRAGLQRLNFERVRTYWAARTGTWLAVDFEEWERESTLLLEFGWSLVRWDQAGTEVNELGHVVIKERMGYTNSQYVAGRRDHYNFGQSELVNLSTFKNRINMLISDGRATGPLFLIFHNSSQDMKVLHSVGAPLTGHSFMLPDETPSSGVYILDTQDLFAALEGNSSGNMRSLEQTCKQLQILPFQNPHNAGNDAHYTMLALKSMASRGPPDAQRQQRWPMHSSANGISVDLPGLDDNPEQEDTDGPNVHNLVTRPTLDDMAMDTD